eukprot:Gregarina_sp_Poly_1__2356@NODE_162_length_12261_cov_105_116123_g144_i0_p6_GENE_NODE_162_length_12261_cov_105_116123_g144_i0NODE_162_length_12261_cov_105_116123_g144_i0_p6_ORF_typecomplete_len196_score8_64zfCCHC_3/PF13917_6/1_6e09zfCCHC/PF00098_23/0_086_NODE_162_length_12261_cov_105_116123_g144_i01102911616
MPATAGRIRMPANNRVSVSDSLKLSEIWQKSVGYDPYAPEDPSTEAPTRKAQQSVDERTKGLCALAMLSGNRDLSTPGACRKCDQVGHLTYQCRNTIRTSKHPAASSPVKDPPSASNENSCVAPERRCKGATHSNVLYKVNRPDSRENSHKHPKRHRCPKGHHHRLSRRYLELVSDANESGEELRGVLRKIAKRR